MTKEYLQWVKQANLQPLTSSQARFAEFLLQDGNRRYIRLIGNMSVIFESVRKFLKENQDIE